MKLLTIIVAVVLLATSDLAQSSEEDRLANTPVIPFRIIGNVYYVGASEVTSFLVTTPKGHILIDAGYAETAPQIEANIKTLGFRPSDVKILLNTQAHFDHAGGLIEMKRLTKAKLVASAADRVLLEDGGRNDFAFGNRFLYVPVKVDRIIRDGDSIKLASVELRAILTPGHTKGCTSWALDVVENGRKYNVLFVGSTTSPGFEFYGNKKYPGIIADFEHTFAVMKALHPDVFLASHGSFFDLTGKAERIRSQPKINPFVDPDGYRTFLTNTEKDFREKLVRQKPAN